MADFSKAIAVVLEHEGGFVDDPVDPGGATNWGVSLRWLESTGDLLRGDIDRDGDIDADDIRQMTREQAVSLYRHHFWDANEYARIAHNDVATKVFDMAVNMGPRQAHKLLQRAAQANLKHCVDDGILGPVTFRVVNHLSAEALLPAIRSEQAGFYRYLTAKKPKLNKYINGWLRRAYS